ncbi:hypothetical protein WOLCODRAFT_140538 [Wolfiporia cocos MD-104 SS10]|uniref:Uncharacterized protein n=1 Tax=Wolfiporia cocos (strain MD-104) TaxID=742152 RepID=A0A2H3J4P2_WOLCO|nr:hypothetical protein WOLCODRAFT_140538 [Wolfiporia cocos MD-104 SS10]
MSSKADEYSKRGRSRSRERGPRDERRDRSREAYSRRSRSREQGREKERQRRGGGDRRRGSHSHSRSRSPPRRHRHSRSRSRSHSRTRDDRKSKRDHDGRRGRYSSSRSRSPRGDKERRRDRSRERRKHSRSRSRSVSSSASDSSDRRRHKRKKEKKSRKHEDKKKDKKDKKKKINAASHQWGKYGIINESDLFTKEQEFRAWLVEERKINPETISKEQTKREFARFVEDYNTATLPHEKFYHMEAYERRMNALRAGEFVPPPDDAYDPDADLRALQSSHRRRAIERETYMSKEQLQELRKVQNERIEAGKMKLLGMDIKQNMGVRMDGSMFDG